MAMSGNCRITVVGSNMIDLVSYLDRVPDRGETVFGRSFDQGFGGKGANQAVMAALLGGRVDIVTCVGDDLFGPKWFDHFKACDVGSSHITTIAGINSGVAAIWVEPAGDNRIVLSGGANDHVSPSLVDEAFDRIDATNVVLSQLEIPQPAIVRGFVHARARGAVTVLNPGPASVLGQDLLGLTDWLLPNETELRLLAREMFGLEHDDDVALARQFARKSGIKLVVTLGDRGAAYVDPAAADDAVLFAAPKVSVADTTGAGDAFAGAFAYGLAAKMGTEASVRLAIAVSADSVTRRGTSVSYARGPALDAIRQAL